MLIAAALLWMAALSGYDLLQRRLPNWLTLPGAVVVLMSAGVAGHPLPALTGAAALVAVYLLVHLGAPAALGAGDVKLALGLGGLAGCFGVAVWFLAALGAALLTALLGVVAKLRGGTGQVPHGPSMCAATAAAVALAVW